MIICFCEVFVISRLSAALGISSWITCGPIFVPADVSLFKCLVSDFSFGVGPIFCNKFHGRPTCGLDGYIISNLGLGKVRMKLDGRKTSRFGSISLRL